MEKQNHTKIIIAVIIIITYLFSHLGIAIHLNNGNFPIDDFSNTRKIAFLFGFPFSLSILFLYFSLRKLLVFKILLISSFLLLIATGAIIYSGYYQTEEMYQNVYDNIFDIRLMVYISVLIIAFIKREKGSTIIYILLALFIVLFYKLDILELLVNSNADEFIFGIKDKEDLFNLVVNFYRMIDVIKYGVLLFISYSYGVYGKENFNEEENEYNIESN